jgi:predicted porin
MNSDWSDNARLGPKILCGVLSLTIYAGGSPQAALAEGNPGPATTAPAEIPAPQNISSPNGPPEALPKKRDRGLTYRGITLYGTIDVGIAHMTHGAPLSAYYGPGLPFVIQKFNNRPITSITPNGLGQSKIGLSGVERLSDDLTAVFKLETGFQPTSGHLADGPRSLIVNNRLPLDQQITSGDSSRAGQVFQGAAYAGVVSKTWGALTVGRQTSILLDNFARYDPQALAQAFSVLGYTGFTAGAGTTQTARLNPSAKYTYAQGPARFAVAHQFGSTGAYPGNIDQVDLGFDYKGFSADVTYTHVSDAISESSLNAAQEAANPGTLAATISDDTSYVLEGKYVFGRAKLYAGYENITFANPSHPLAAGFKGIGGYRLSVVNNTAYSIHRVTQVSWVGASYNITPKLGVSAGYYRYDQNSFKGNGCADTSFSSCSGNLTDYSIVGDYRFSRTWDVYAGVNHSGVSGGLASGYLQTANTSPMAGVRLNF